MRLIIAGSRDIDSPTVVKDALRVSGWEHAVEVVISGACALDERVGIKIPPFAKGVDGLGERWARERRLRIERFFAKWYRSGRYDPSEGPKRNRLMAEVADAALVIPHPDPDRRRGSTSMIHEAKVHGLHLCVFDISSGEVQLT